MKKRVFKVWCDTDSPLWWEGESLRIFGNPTFYKFKGDNHFKITVEKIKKAREK